MSGSLCKLTRRDVSILMSTSALSLLTKYCGESFNVAEESRAFFFENVREN